jgi:hypothetical protein
MSDQTEATKVEAAFNKIADATEADPSSITVVIEESLGEKRISYSDVAESAPENKTRADSEDDEADEGADDESARDNSRADSEDGDDESAEGDEVDIHFKEMDYTDLQKLASEELDEYPDDRSQNGLAEALEEADISFADDDTTEGGENDEDAPLHPDEAENPTKENYVFHFGVCDSDDCSYGTANEESDYCASCSKKHDNSSESSSSEKTNADKVQEVKDLFEISQIEAEAVVYQVSEGNYDSHSEAVKNHL